MSYLRLGLFDLTFVSALGTPVPEFDFFMDFFGLISESIKRTSFSFFRDLLPLIIGFSISLGLGVISFGCLFPVLGLGLSCSKSSGSSSSSSSSYSSPLIYLCSQAAGISWGWPQPWGFFEVEGWSGLGCCLGCLCREMRCFGQKDHQCSLIGPQKA